MEDEGKIILEEITQEVKHDNLIKFLNKHQRVITGVVLVTIATIVMYTSWKSNVNKELHDTTRALFQAINTSNKDNEKAILNAMIENAPARLLPVVKIIRAGVSLSNDTKDEERNKICSDLLALYNENGLEQEWKDLAMLLYANSVNGITIQKLIEMLKPLTEQGRPFRLSAKELIGVLYMTSGNKSEAIKMFDQVILDGSATESMRVRCEMFKSRT